MTKVKRLRMGEMGPEKSPRIADKDQADVPAFLRRMMD